VNGPTALLVVSVTVPAVGFAAAALARFALGRRRQWWLGWAASTLCGIVGAALGAGTTALAMDRSARQAPVAVVLGGLAGTALVLGAAELIARRRFAYDVGASELIAAGESARVEFKSSARVNRHTGARDTKMEQVIASSTAAFFNAGGGTLLIGVADDGTIAGLEADYALQRVPGRDGFELWLHDLLGGGLGAAAAASVRVDFEQLNGRDICLLRIPPSPRPVYLQSPKQRGTEFVVRVGNSSRRLDARELVEYAAGHWGARTLRARSVGARSVAVRTVGGGSPSPDVGNSAPAGPAGARLAPNARPSPPL
jgi:hypothetical protein